MARLSFTLAVWTITMSLVKGHDIIFRGFEHKLAGGS
jgi:hypothetical protein